MEGDQGAFRADKDVKLKVTHLYTNRSLSHHQLGDHQKAFDDADHVLRFLDDKNVKALNRRATANKALGRIEESIRDYQVLLKVNPAGEKEINKEVGELMKKLVEINKAKKANPAPAQQEQPKSLKIQEMTATQTPVAAAAAEASKAEEDKPKPASGKTKQIDAETLSKAVEITSEKINKKLLNKVPLTAAGFESDFMSLKKDVPTFYAYVHNIPLETIPKLFKSVEISAELFAAILRAVVEHGLGDAEGVEHAAKLLVALAQGNNFDMTLMFMDSKEKKDLVTIIGKLKTGAIDAEVLKKINNIYKL